MKSASQPLICDSLFVWSAPYFKISTTTPILFSSNLLSEGEINRSTQPWDPWEDHRHPADQPPGQWMVQLPWNFTAFCVSPNSNSKHKDPICGALVLDSAQSSQNTSPLSSLCQPVSFSGSQSFSQKGDNWLDCRKAHPAPVFPQGCVLLSAVHTTQPSLASSGIVTSLQMGVLHSWPSCAVRTSRSWTSCPWNVPSQMLCSDRCYHIQCRDECCCLAKTLFLNEPVTSAVSLYDHDWLYSVVYKLCFCFVIWALTADAFFGNCCFTNEIEFNLFWWRNKARLCNDGSHI